VGYCGHGVKLKRWYGALCQDTDDGKIYKWNGTSLEEIADVTGPEGGVADGDVAGFDGATGKVIKKITSLYRFL